MSSGLWRAAPRDLTRHPWLTGLSLLGIALGVAVALAVDLAVANAHRAFDLSMEALTGRATHHIEAGPRGVPDDLYRRLRVEAGVRAGAPVVEGYIKSAGRTLHLLGIDPFAERGFRDHLRSTRSNAIDLAALITRPGAVVMGDALAAGLALDERGGFEVEIAGRHHRLTRIGVLEPRDALQREAFASLLLCDIATAQELLGRVGRLSRIDLRLAPSASETRAAIEALLPPDARIVETAGHGRALRSLTRAFDTNLQALSLLALLVGLFLIYNTMNFSVVRRRDLFGRLRALGVTRRELFMMVTGEALLVGLIGTLLGIALGVALGAGLSQLVTRTINDLYFVLAVSGYQVTPALLAKGAALGLGATLIAALLPARSAMATPPRVMMNRSALEGRTRLAGGRWAVMGLAVLGLGGLLLMLPARGIVVGFLALFTLVLGAALLAPWLTVRLMGALQRLGGRRIGVVGRLALRGVVASLSRTSVAVAALLVAVAVAVGMEIMVQSFRLTVEQWLEQRLRADLFISPPATVSGHYSTPLDPTLAAAIVALPEVASHGSYRGVSIQSDHGTSRLAVMATTGEARRGYRFQQTAAERAWRAVDEGAVLISEPYAFHNRLAVGDTLKLTTDHGVRPFPIAGIYYDYDRDRGIVLMERAIYQRHWDDRAITTLGLYLKAGADIDAVARKIEALSEGRQRLRVRSTRELRELSLAIFDRTFAITGVLRLLAVVVAFIGVVSALMALQLERARELAVLRATGLTPTQLWGLVTTQNGLMGLAAGLMAMPLGAALAWVLTAVINRRSFGWSLELAITPWMLGEALLLALSAALLAGLYPAWRMGRARPARALREE